MKLSEIIKKGALKYTHHYCIDSTADHTLPVPPALVILAKNSSAESVCMGYGTLGIEIDGEIWALEINDNPYYPDAKTLNRKVWQYCTIALGKIGDTYSTNN